MIKRVALLIASAFLGMSAQAAPSLQLNPVNGGVFGAPGTTTGWGFTLTNPDNYYLEVTGSEFNSGCQGCPAPAGTIGTYSDFIGNNFIVLGPAPEPQSLSQPFSEALLTGVGSFTIGNTVSAGTTIPGYIEVDYATYSVDPNSGGFDPKLDLITADAQLYAPVVVNAPEPSSYALMLAALALLITVARQRVRSYDPPKMR